MKSNATVRLFLALWPDDELRAALARWQLGWTWTAAAALVRPERMHLTLHFIGPVDPARLDALREGLDVPAEPCTLALDGGAARVWPGGIAVLEMAAPPSLQRLHARLGDALQALGLPVESRPWRPHVTFARKAAGTQPPRAAPPVQWHAGGRYVLVRSTPGRGYDILHRHGPP